MKGHGKARKMDFEIFVITLPSITMIKQKCNDTLLKSVAVTLFESVKITLLKSIVLCPCVIHRK